MGVEFTLGDLLLSQRGLVYLVNSYRFYFKQVCYFKKIIFKYVCFINRKLIFLITHFITFAFTIFHEFFVNALPTFEPTQTNLLQVRQVFVWTVIVPNKETRVISKSCRPRNTVPDS